MKIFQLVNLLFLNSLCLGIAFSLPANAAIKVVATIKPIHSLVAGVMKGVAHPHLLVEVGTSHTYALKPSDARALQNADIVIWIGPQMEKFLIAPLKSLATKALIVPLEKAKGLTLHVIGPPDQPKTKPGTRHRHRHRHQHHNIDPHIWLDPQNAQAFIREIATKLAATDPDHKAQYWSNAKKMISRLDALIGQIQTTLSPLRGVPYLTFHDAFRYFEKRFNLNNVGSIILNPDRPPGGRHLRAMQRKIKTLAISCIFSEPYIRPGLLHLMLEGSQARTVTLDPIGITIPKGPELYYSLLNNNAKAFISCLRGP